MEKRLYAQVIKFWRKDVIFYAANKIKMNQNLNFKVNPQDHNYGLISIQIGLT